MHLPIEIGAGTTGYNATQRTAIFDRLNIAPP